MYKQCQLIIEFTLSNYNHYSLLSVSKVRWPELSQLSLCSEFDKENSMEFSLISLPTYTFYYRGYALTLPWSSCYSSHVTPCDCDLWRDHLWLSVTPLWHCDKVMWYFPVLYFVVLNKKRKEKKRNINNDLANLPSHDMVSIYMTSLEKFHKISQNSNKFK